jgi:hypothetical protein
VIKKGCVIASVVMLGLFGGYLYLLWGKVEAVAAIILALFGSLGLVMVVSQLKAVIFGSGDEGPLRRAEQGLPLVDGEKEAVWGPVEPLGELLTAPFSGRPCIAYEYDAMNPETTGSDGRERSGGSAISGFALCPSVIRSNRGDVRLCGFSILDKFEKTLYGEDAEARLRSERYAAQTRFETMGLSKIGSMLSQMDEAMADDDGSVRKDWKLKDGEIALERCELEEKIIAPGEMITVVGIWDAARGGIVPKKGGKSAIVQLMPGGGLAMVMHAEKRPWGTLVFALVWAGLAHLVIWLAWTRGFE